MSRAPTRGYGRYEHCIVAYLDILGFASLVERLPANEISGIIDQFHTFNRTDDVPATRMQEMRLNPRLFVFQISDAVVRTTTLENETNDGAMFWELWSLALVQIELISAGVLVRGGVSVGEVNVGLNGDGPIFGPAMIRAFRIESEEAIYPRIVVDDEAIEAALRIERNLDEPLDIPDEVRTQIRSLLATGEDGTLYIDYLRAVQPDSTIDLNSVLISHKNLIESGLTEHASPRIRRKFQWLAHYHDSFVAEFFEANSNLLIDYG